jgi:hypothetical protein
VAPFHVKVLDIVIISIAILIFSFIGLGYLSWVLSLFDLFEKVFTTRVILISYLLSLLIWGVLVRFLGFLSGYFPITLVDIIVSIKVSGLV